MVVAGRPAIVRTGVELDDAPRGASDRGGNVLLLDVHMESVEEADVVGFDVINKPRLLRREAGPGDQGRRHRRRRHGRPQRFHSDPAADPLPQHVRRRALVGTSLTFVSEVAVAGGLARKLKVQKRLVAVQNTRGKMRKKSMVHNGATPRIEIDPETYAVTAYGELLVCEPADKLPMAQRYFLFLEADPIGLNSRRAWIAVGLQARLSVSG